MKDSGSSVVTLMLLVVNLVTYYSICAAYVMTVETYASCDLGSQLDYIGRDDRAVCK
jgi:hypothetical protein